MVVDGLEGQGMFHYVYENVTPIPLILCSLSLSLFLSLCRLSLRDPARKNVIPHVDTRESCQDDIMDLFFPHY